MGDVMDFLSNTSDLEHRDQIDLSLRACGVCENSKNCGNCTVGHRSELLRAAQDAQDDMAGEGDDDAESEGL